MTDCRLSHAWHTAYHVIEFEYLRLRSLAGRVNGERARRRRRGENIGESVTFCVAGCVLFSFGSVSLSQPSREMKRESKSTTCILWVCLKSHLRHRPITRVLPEFIDQLHPQECIYELFIKRFVKIQLLISAFHHSAFSSPEHYSCSRIPSSALFPLLPFHSFFFLFALCKYLLSRDQFGSIRVA